MIPDLLIHGATVVKPTGLFRVNVGISRGKIAMLSSPSVEIEARRRLDATGMLLLPGLVDPHVHAGYGEPERETITAVSKAAAAGGVTTIMDQPLSKPSTVTRERLSAKKGAFENGSVVDFALWGGLVPGHIEDLGDMMEEGAQAFKAFMCRCSNYPMSPDGVLLRGMRRLGELGGLVGVHAENDTLIQDLLDEFLRQGKRDERAFLDSHPVYSELEAIKRFIFLGELVPACKCHLLHVSIPEGVLEVQEARRRGVTNISVETCPQYLALNEDDLLEIGGVAKCDPPVRSRESVERLWELVIEGAVDMIVSDHSPHPTEKKTQEKDFASVPEGVTGVQTLLPVVVTEGLKRGLSWPKLVSLVSTNPAKRFGLCGRKGDIEVGFDADLVVFNPRETWTLREDDLFYANRHSPFVGRTFTGKVVETLVRGETVYADGRITVDPGFGQFLKMEMV